jgi:hypothetical protein
VDPILDGFVHLRHATGAYAGGVSDLLEPMTITVETEEGAIMRISYQGNWRGGPIMPYLVWLAMGRLNT